MIEVQNLTKEYGPRLAISNLSFSIARGEIVGFLGPNGAGKSTTMKILTGFMPATSGTAQVAGFDVFSHPLEVKRNVGYLPENPPVYLDMQVEDYLSYAAELKDLSRGAATKAVAEAIEKTGLGSVRHRIIGNLSKGYRQRVGLAQALVHNPQVLILDEPTVGLDPVQIIEIRELIRSLAGAHTVILSSHILPEVTATCQRVIIIARGEIMAQDTIEALTAKMQVQGTIPHRLTVKKIVNEGVAAIRALSGVKELKASGNQLTLEIDSGATEIRDQVTEAAVRSGMGVLEFSADRLSLEAIYLKLTNN
jgi:ABC-2 type transport system ATP-binding protein